MNKLQKILLFLGFDIVIDEHPFGGQRIIQRGKKQILQQLTQANWVEDSHWEDIKEVEI